MTDFSTLANIARPQMMGRANSVIAGTMYGDDMARQDNYLARAAQEAEMNAQQKAMQAEEFSMAAPGRRAQIELGNMQGQDKATDYRQNGKADMMRKRMMDELKDASGILQAIAAANTEEEVAAVLANADFLGNTKIRGKDITKMPPALAKKMADWYMQGQVQSPKHQQAMEVESQKGANKAALEIYKQAGANTRAEKAMVARQAIERMKREKPDKYSIVMKYAEENNVSPFEALAFLQTAGIIQQGQNTVDQANAILPPNKQMPSPTMVQPPSKAAPAAASTNQKPNVVKGNTFNGKVVTDVMRDKSGNPIKVKLEDGSVVDFK